MLYSSTVMCVSLSQCWSGEDRDTDHHRLGPGTAVEGETGGCGWDHQTPPQTENENGPDTGEWKLLSLSHTHPHTPCFVALCQGLLLCESV